MKAIGAHLLIRKPPKKDKEGEIILPLEFEQVYAYGKVLSVGDQVASVLGGVVIKEGDLVCYDHFGSRTLEMSHKDSELVVVHASQLFCTIAAEQLEARKLPLPK